MLCTATLCKKQGLFERDLGAAGMLQGVPGIGSAGPGELEQVGV